MFSNQPYINMTKLASIMTAAFLFSAAASAAAAGDVTFGNVKVERSESLLQVGMDIDATGLKLKSDSEIIYRPAVVAGDSVYALPAVVIAGRNRYIQNDRHEITADGTILSRAGRNISYTAFIPYRQWMEQSSLTVSEDECGCGLSTGTPSDRLLTAIDFMERKFEPVFVMVTPPVEQQKNRSAEGSAYIDFPVNRTEIHPDYRRNPEELASIRSTIDIVANDPDTRITSINIKGFASPEGSYANNARLAAGRAASLAEYVRNLYSFDAGLMTTSSEPENWAGLRQFVAISSLPDTAAMLAIIDNGLLDPDAREMNLQRSFPDQYRYLRENVYPGLRRSDYTIRYVVRSYISVEEIKKVMATAPQKLSANEIYAVAATLDPDSPDYREAFELAVRLFPDNEAANLNMAAIALQRDELVAAARYLSKSGSSPRAEYARGIYRAKTGDYDSAVDYLSRAESAGIPEATDAIRQLRLMGVISE